MIIFAWLRAPSTFLNVPVPDNSGANKFRTLFPFKPITRAKLNDCMEIVGKFPDGLKMANLTHVNKKDETTDKENHKSVCYL